MQLSVEYIDLGADRRLAFRHRNGAVPAVMFLPGLRSDMDGAKATALAAHCATTGRGFLSLDYRGHGRSSGRFEDGCIGDWLADALAVLDHSAEPSVVLVGSSMGGWLMLLMALARPDKTKGLVGVAAAPDFTEDLMIGRATPAELDELARYGVLHVPSIYGEPLPVTRRLIEEGRKHLLLRAPIPVACPVHLLHGQLDPDVSWTTALRLAARLESPAVTVELVGDGDHRLSRELDLRRISAAVDRLVSLATTGRPA
ncbi:MAG TPA: alpha/beta hydrolase [Geminicoccaceae bacterium]|nr:alpha/beta hydrolase [Geminicoccus sp.]HMU50728.1 alpha/beta hydrolase [Geminicoccaceae bacterium]